MTQDLKSGRTPATGAAGMTLLLSGWTTASYLARGRLHLPRGHVGTALRFADGSKSEVFRETTLSRPPTADPCVLVVEFRLRAVTGRGHRAFRGASLLSTPLFAGFPGFFSKLWLGPDQRGVYRGLYEWDGPALAEHYARTVHHLLAVVCVPGSVQHHLLPGVRRDALLAAPERFVDPARRSTDEASAWWRPVKAS